MFFRKPELPSKFNICLVSTQFPLSNSADDISFLWPIARGLVKQGHTVTVLSWRNKRRIAKVEKDGVKALFLGETPGATPDRFPTMVLRKFQELHAKEPFHLVHSLDATGVQI